MKYNPTWAGCWYAKSDIYSFQAVLLEILTGQCVKYEFWHNEEDDDDDDLLNELGSSSPSC